MATFDQLPADQRAIIELVLKRGRTYDALSDMLDMPASRVRELARDALSELAPYTSERVDPDWRDQVADYVLGQQSGPESTATRGHISRSEPARAWLLSLLDSLDQLYANGRRPEVPEPEAGTGRARDRRERADRERTRERGRRERDGESAAVATATRDRTADKDKAKKADKGTDEGDGKAAPKTGDSLSPAARAAVKRRRLIAGAAALAAIILAVVLILSLTGGDDDDGGGDSNAGNTTNTNAQQRPQPQLIGQLELTPVGDRPRSTRGIAGIAKVGNEFQLVVQAQLPPRPQGSQGAYEVWLYNSAKDAVSVGAQNTDAQGVYQGQGAIPADYEKYKYIDISAEPLNNQRAHSGRSVLRGELANLQAPPPAGQGGQGGQGGQPAPGQPAPGQPGQGGATP